MVEGVRDGDEWEDTEGTSCTCTRTTVMAEC